MMELVKCMLLVVIINGNVDLYCIGLGDYFELILKVGLDGLVKFYFELFDKVCIYLVLLVNLILYVGDYLVIDV